MAFADDPRPAWKKILDLLITIFIYVMIAYVISTWIPPLRDSPVGDLLRLAASPVLAPIEKVIPSVGGIGISPIIAYFGLSFIQRQFLRN